MTVGQSVDRILGGGLAGEVTQIVAEGVWPCCGSKSNGVARAAVRSPAVSRSGLASGGAVDPRGLGLWIRSGSFGAVRHVREAAVGRYR